MRPRNVFPLLAVLTITITIFVLSRQGRTGRDAAGTAPRYDLSRYRITDPRLVGYLEAQTIPLAGDEPTALALDGEGNIYVAAGEKILVHDGRGSRRDEIALSSPVGAMAIGPAGDIYLAMGDRIEVRRADGAISAGIALGEKAIITSLAASEDNLYAADAGNGMVWHFDAEGRLEGTFGRRNLAAGEMGFVVPSPYFDVALGDDEVLWAVNPGRLRVQRHTPDGRLVDFWGTPTLAAEGFGGCCNPSHIAVLPDGSFVTSEKGLPRVKIYGPDGGFESVVAGPESFRPGTVGLDLAADTRGRIIVLDPARKTVRIFVRRGEGKGAGDGT